MSGFTIKEAIRNTKSYSYYNLYWLTNTRKAFNYNSIVPSELALIEIYFATRPLSIVGVYKQIPWEGE